MKRTHAALIKLWADGAEIQVNDGSGEWFDSQYPSFSDDLEYRIKPESFATGIEKQVCQDIAGRQQRGIEKYGITIEENPLTHKEWLQHAYEEALDLSIYLKKIITELE